MKGKRSILMTSIAFITAIFWLSACSGSKENQPPPEKEKTTSKSYAKEAPPDGPRKIALVETPLDFQDEKEPFKTEAVFEFELPRPPRRARLKLRYSGVPGATSEDYTMGKFRHKIELNNAFLMDLNTHSKDESQIVEYTKWISVGMFRRNNQLKFSAGDDGNREQRPNCDEFQLRSAVLEFDW